MFQEESTAANDRNGDMRCLAAINVQRMRKDAALAKAQNRMTAKSALLSSVQSVAKVSREPLLPMLRYAPMSAIAEQPDY